MAFDSGLGEWLTRYIGDSKHIRTSDNSVRHAVFTPPKTHRLSVYWISGVDEATIWKIGNTHVAPTRRAIIARADFNSLIAYEARLSIEVTGIPHPRHADIVGWDFDSSRVRLQAIKLANSAILRRIPT